MLVELSSPRPQEPAFSLPRLIRAGAAGLVLGAVAGFLAALVRPRSDARYPSSYQAPRPVARPGSAVMIDLREASARPAGR